MRAPEEQTVAILLASGLSRRFKRRDKLMQDLGGMPLVEHSAGRLAEMNFLARVAVCPPRSDMLRSRLDGRFIIAPNASPEAGLGVSISVGVRVAMQFRPAAVLLCLGDMPFVEAASFSALLQRFYADENIDIVHSGEEGGQRPPTVFGRSCFESLQVLTGDQGAGALVQRSAHSSVAFGLPEPELFDVDTSFDLETARQQWQLRQRHLGSGLRRAGSV